MASLLKRIIDSKKRNKTNYTMIINQ